MAGSPSANEAIKAGSRHLRGTIADDLATDDTSFSADNQVLLKFHGIYQQDNRDVRSERTRAKAGLDYICMVRAAVPGGMLTAEQYLAADSITDEVGNGTLRVTTRQGLQFHFVRKGGLQPLIRTLNEHLVTTLAACGDVVRNLCCCPAPLADRESAEVQRYAHDLAARLKPKTHAYWSLWVDGEAAVTAAAPEEEPLYRDTYLPRKFKIALAWPGDNCVDVYTQDVGIVPVLSGGTEGELEGFTILVGGGLGKSHTDATTYPRLGDPMITVAPDELLDVVETIVAVQRDNGNRSSRDHARLKYLIDGWGLPRFRAEVESRMGRSFADPEPLAWQGADEHLGWHKAGDGSWFLGVPVPSGRIADVDGTAYRTGLRRVVEELGTDVRLTPRQDVLLTGIEDDRRADVHRILKDAGIPMADDVPELERLAVACPALPTCGLALTDAERVMPAILRDVQAELDRAGVADPAPEVRVTGCPNGCARPYSAEVGLVGRGKKSYDVHLGGDRSGTRLAEVFAENVPRDQVAAVLGPLLGHYRTERHAGEGLGDFCAREGVAELRSRFGNESWVRKRAG